MHKQFFTILTVMMSLSFTMASKHADAQAMSGTYTNYETFEAAVSAVTAAGVSGQVVFEMAPGTYNEFVNIGDISGVSETNRVIFRGAGANNQQVVITSNAGYASHPTVKLDNADYISFENITITTTSTNYTNLVEFENNVNHIHFNNVAFIGYDVNEQTYNNDKHLVYDKSGDITDTDIRFTNCSFTNGYIALYMYGKNLNIHDEGLVIENCTFTNQYSKSIYMTFQDNPIVRGNVITNSKDLKNGFQAIDGYRCYYGGIIENNVIDIDFNSCYATGIELRPAIGTAENPFIIRNNMVRVKSNANNNYCYTLSDNTGEYVNFAHNTGLLGGNGSGTMLYVENAFSNYNVINNLLINEAGGYIFWIKSTSAEGRVFDHNRFSIPAGAMFGKFGGTEYSSLSEWTAATNFDTHSASCTASFVSNSDLHITASDGITVSNRLPYVAVDIDGESRAANTCAGADEYYDGQDLPPYIANQLAPIQFTDYPQQLVFDLSNTFDDPDDPSDMISLNIEESPSYVTASISSKTLTVTRNTPETFENETLIIRATSNDKFVDMSVLVSSEAAQDLPPYIANQLAPIQFTDYPQQLVFDLSNTFDDPDDPSDMISLNIEESSSYVSASISSKTLTVTRNTPLFFVDNIVIRATSDGQHIDMSVQLSADEVSVELSTATFEDVTLGGNGVWTPQPGYNSMLSGSWSFSNFYDPTFWGGFTASNHTDTTVTGMDAQYTSVTGGGRDGSANYAVAYTFGAETTVIAVDEMPHSISGCYVTNNLWAYQSIVNGDYTSTPFGGTSGNDPDYFLLYAIGRNADSQPLDTAFFYLADYRFDDNTQDYVVDSWQWFDLSGLGEVSSISFHLVSTKSNAYGMLTPAYFCMDDFFSTDNQDLPPYIANQLAPILFTDYPQQLVFDLSNTFDDPDDPSDMISLNIEESSSYVSASISSKTLTVTRNTPETFENETLTIRATSNDKFVDMIVEISAENDTTSVAEHPDNQLVVFPNPAHDKIFVSSSCDFTSYTIIDLSGKIMKNGDIISEHIDIQDINTGIYFIIMNGEKSTAKAKIIKY